VGRGAPEIDILEVEHNKTTSGTGQVASQSAQFAPFTHDYSYDISTADQYVIYTPEVTKPNSYKCVLSSFMYHITECFSFPTEDLLCESFISSVFVIARSS
jgi:hypothetical protein